VLDRHKASLINARQEDLMIRASQNPSHRRLFAIVVLLSCLGWQLAAKEPLKQKQLIRELDKHLDSSLVKGGKLGLGVWDAISGTQVYGYQDSLFQVPAATQKLFTAIAAIEQLGPDFRWQTRIGYQGQILDGSLQGDLIIVGSGDPSWHEDFWPKGGKQVFELWADSLSARGIQSIEGNLVANVSHYPTRPWNESWDLSDKPYYYAPAVSSLSFNANRVVFELKGGKASGRKVAISTLDGYDYIKLDNSLKTSKKGKSASTWAESTSDPLRFVIKGRVPAGGRAQEKIAVREPELFAMRVLKEVLEQRDILIKGKIITCTVPPNPDSLQILFRHLSPPLGEVIGVMLKTSSNFIAESVLNSLDPSYEEALRKTVQTALDLQIPTQGLRILDGSGLSRTALCSPAQLGSLLCAGTRQDWFELFLSSLSVAGKDGTLEKRLRKSPAKGAVFGKTGSMKGVSNLAGYVKTADGTLLAMVIFCTQLKSVADARQWQDRLCEILYRYSSDK